MLRFACFLLLIPLALSAQERLTGNDFDAFTRGQTFYCKVRLLVRHPIC